MPLVLANRVQETTATTGTGTITLAGAVSGYQSFAAIGNGNTTYYTITSGTAWEVGIGTYSTTGPTLARTTILSSSAGGAAITLVGVSTVFSTYPANRSVNYDETNSLTLSGTAISAPAWTTTGIGIKQVATTYTDTTSTGTVPNVYINNFAAQTLAATNTITVSQLYGVFFNTPTAGTNVTATERWSVGTDTLRVTGGILMDGTAGNFIQLATAMTSGQFILGNTAGTGNMTLGRSTVSQTTNIQAGATASGSTKTINLGTGGLAGSTTTITIGSTAGTSTTTLNGAVSVASTIAAALGSAAAPSYTFTGDLNTGMWSPAADTIAFSEGGTEAMRITSAGNVGIGTSSPAERLTVNSASSEYAIQWSGPGNDWVLGSAATRSYIRNKTASVETLTILNAGNVGIGETSPGAKLHVSGGVVGTTAGNLVNVIIDQGGAGSNAVGIRTNLVRVSNGTDWTTTAMRLQGRVDATNFGYIDLVSGGAQGLAFGSDASERMRVDASGNLLVGTTSATGRLTVQTAGSDVGYFDTTDTTGGPKILSIRSIAASGTSTPTLAIRQWRTSFAGSQNAGEIRFDGLTTTGSYAEFASIYATSGANSASGAPTAITFQTMNASYVTAERMRIASDGSVGIGTTSPATKLHVSAASGYNEIRVASGANNLGLSIDGSAAYLAAFQSMPLTFQTNSTERMRIDSAGNVGVGTSSPGVRFDVTGQGRLGNGVAQASPSATDIASTSHTILGGQGGNALFVGQYATTFAAWLQSSFTNPTTATYNLVLQPLGGNVGIGTASPGAKLDVVGNASFGAAITTGTGLSTGDAQLEVGGNRSGNGPAYMDLHAVAGGDFSARVLRTGGTNGNMEIANAGTGVLTIATNGTEKMRVESGGNVGIGTTAPTTIFHVQQNNAANIGMRTRQLSTTQFAGAGLLCNGPVSSGAQGGTAFYHYNRNTGGTNGALAMAQFDETGAFQRSLAEYYYQEQAWIFYTNSNERFRIDNAGNVGIGTSGPGYRLDIAAGDTTAGLGYAMRVRSNATATAATIQFTNSAVSTQNGIIACSDTGAMTIQTDGASSLLAFRTNGNERFRILSTGGITSSDLADAVGYKGVPQNSQTASYTLALSDMGKHISITTGGVVIPANGSVAFPIGSTITVYNNSASAQNISITTDTLRLAGTATTGTRSLAQRGLATCIKVAATEWVVTGNVT
jgi:hypothetical protein